ncbi:TIGR00730 family Rossman fold protein [Naumannella halotolerans]|uniref:LOG family protein n=1 Tax=Naumannella halotolerans TaxID=993414 RepID=UPI00370D4450
MSNAAGQVRRAGSITVFAGAAAGIDDRWAKTAYELGRLIAQGPGTLVFGAGGTGLMGAVSDGALDHGGHVVGVIPESMIEKEWARPDLTELIVTDGMHERKKIMASRADGFICLPGGAGTLEELVEIWSWVNLGFLDSRIVLLDDNGFWQPLLELVQHFERSDFLGEQTRRQLLVAEDPAEALVMALG